MQKVSEVGLRSFVWYTRMWKRKEAILKFVDTFIWTSHLDTEKYAVKQILYNFHKQLIFNCISQWIQRRNDIWIFSCFGYKNRAM